MTRRIAISLPDELFQRVERLRKRVPRSKWIQEAVGDYVQRVDEDALVAAYFGAPQASPLASRRERRGVNG